jgi:hypothetical protein
MSSSNPILEHMHHVSGLGAQSITLQQQPADTVATVRTNADLLQEPTDETRTCAVTSEISKRALKGKFPSLEGNSKGTDNNVSSPNQQMECAEANEKSSGMSRELKVSVLVRSSCYICCQEDTATSFQVKTRLRIVALKFALEHSTIFVILIGVKMLGPMMQISMLISFVQSERSGRRK